MNIDHAQQKRVDAAQKEYDRCTAAIEELTAARAAAESDAAEARAKLAELTDGPSVLAAMAEERAAMNRAAITRDNLAYEQHQRRELQRMLDAAQHQAVDGLIRQTMNEAAAAIAEAYQAVVAARDEIYQAQRATGAYPVNSPLDAVCSGLERALGAAGGQAIADSSGSVTVRFGNYTYTRRPIGYVPPTPAPARPRRPLVTHAQEMMAELNRFNRQRAHEFSDED